MTFTNRISIYLTAVFPQGSLGSCPGLAALWEEERQRRRLNNESTDIAAPVSQGSNNFLFVGS